MIPGYRGEDFGWTPKSNDPVRLKQGMEKLQRALEIDMIEAERRPSGLPSD